ncbi:MAG: hypothetical protein D6719_10265 [Candidatus Dadabacteria bacterium]|nr:MAG: hypothetical protein D6719_10265 [Candidatus Dadabacteria bacterium]
MELIDTISRNRFKSFVFATLALQVLVVFSGLLLKMRTDSSEDSITEVSFESSADLDDFHSFSNAGASASLHNESEKLTLPSGDSKKNSSKVEKGSANTITRKVLYRVKSGDTLTKIWVSLGADYRGAIKAARAFKSAGVSLTSIKAGEELEVTLADGEILELKKKLPEARILVLEGNAQHGYNATIIKQEIIYSEKRVSGSITRSFAAAAEEVKLPVGIVDAVVDLFSSRIEFSRDLQPGDTFSVIYREGRLKNGELVKLGDIKAASIETGGHLLAAVLYRGKDGKARHYDESGNAIGNYFLRYPVRFTRIASSFSRSRFHPVLKVRRPHNGVDFAAPTGTPVRSVADGLVVQAGYNRANGNWIKIKHGSRYATAYLHLSRIARGIRRGVRVKRGQVIGAVGMTGLATGPHLHFSFYDRGRYVDPLKIRLPQMSADQEKIPQGFLQAALTDLKQQHIATRLVAFMGLPAAFGLK